MTSYSYATKCASLHGMNKQGGFGGPLCDDPYGDKVQTIVKKLLEEAEKDTTMCYNNFTDPAPELTKAQCAMMVGFDYGDKCKPLPFGPLPWPTGLPHPGYVPQTNPLNGRWVTITGGDAEFIKASIAAGTLGAAEAQKIQADVDSKKTAGMFLRITQKNDVCTVDASVAKYARACRTWKSGHYFYEPLVGGSHLLGVWVLPEEYRKIGFFWEMTSGKCFRIQRKASFEQGFLFMRQSTEVFGKISHMYYIKVSTDPESQLPLPALQSRDFTALAGKSNAPDNLGNPYPCEPLDLDAPVKRDVWYDANKATIEQQVKTIGGATQNLESKKDLEVGMGWSTESIPVSVDALWEALTVSARNPEKFMDVSNVTVSDEDGFINRTMTINVNATTVNEHIFINPEASEIVFQPVDDAGKRKHLERVISVRTEPNVHMEYYQRDLTDGMRSNWAAPASALREKVDKVIKLAKQLDGTVEPVVGLGFHSPPLEGIDHEALWMCMLKEVKRPRLTMPKFASVARDGFVERMLPVQRAYVNEHVFEIVLRDVIDGQESPTEQAIILRAHPVELEVCERNVKSGFRVHSQILKEEASLLMDGLINAAKQAMKMAPTTVGLGIVSAPIHCATYDSVITAIERTIRQPWLVMGVEEGTFKGEDKEGYYERTMKVKATGKFVTDQVKVNEEAGEIVYCEPGNPEERVAAVLMQPLRIELYRRDSRTKIRTEWNLPYAAGKDTISALVNFAKDIEDGKSDVVGMGMHSAPLDNSEDSLWRAMIYTAFKPDQFGMKVDQVSIQDKQGFAVRTMRVIPTNRVLTETIRLNEGAREILFRSLVNGVEHDHERVLALRTEPLRFELHKRCTKNEMKVSWNQPTVLGNSLFDCILNAAKSL